MTCGIYKITNKRTKEVYIGQSRNIEKRLEDHKKRLQAHNHINYGLQEDYKQGHKFSYEIIAVVEDDKEKLDEAEKKFIKQHNSFYYGYNQTPGGEYDKLKGHYEKGGDRLIFSKDHYTKTLKEMNHTLKEEPNNEKVLKAKRNFLYDLAKAHKGRHLYPTALEFYNEFLEIEPDNKEAIEDKIDILVAIGYDYLSQKNNREEALIYFNQVLEINPKHKYAKFKKEEIKISILLEESRKLYTLKQFDDAYEINKKILEIDEYNYDASENIEKIMVEFYKLAKNCLAEEEYEKSDEYLEKIQEYDEYFDPEDHELESILIDYYNLAKSYFEKEEYEKAIEYLEKIQEYDAYFDPEDHGIEPIKVN